MPASLSLPRAVTLPASPLDLRRSCRPPSPCLPALLPCHVALFLAPSGSAAERVAEHAARFAPDVNTHAPSTHVACALPQSTSAAQAPASGPTVTVVGNPPLFSATVQLVRSALPALATT